MMADHDPEFEALLDDALGGVDLSTAAHGVGRQAQARGVDSLSPDQLAVFDRQLWPAMGRVAEGRERTRRADLLSRD